MVCHFPATAVGAVGGFGAKALKEVSMGPTNIALVKLYRADQELRTAQGRYDSANRSVRVQEGKIANLSEQLKLASTRLRESQSQAAQLDLDVRSRDERIERLRTQQQTAKNHKEYQAFLTEISSEKIDKGKSEDESLKAMEVVETQQAEVKDLQAQLEAEQQKNAVTKQQLASKLAELQAEIDRLKPIRDAAAKPVSPRAMELYERMADRYEGETMAAIGKPDRRREEYVCMACHMDLVADMYNKLHARDEPMPCPNCRRLLYIPDDLPPDMAINKPKERKEPALPKAKGGKGKAAAVARQSSAVDVLRSMTPEEEEGEEALRLWTMWRVLEKRRRRLGRLPAVRLQRNLLCSSCGWHH